LSKKVSVKSALANVGTQCAFHVVQTITDKVNVAKLAILNTFHGLCSKVMLQLVPSVNQKLRNVADATI